MEIEPIVGALEVIDGKSRQNGDQLLAEYTAAFAGMRVRGLHLIRTGDGGFKTVSPAVGRRDDRQAISFTDKQVQHRLTESARALYRLMGGKFGDYAGQLRQPGTPSGDES